MKKPSSVEAYIENNEVYKEELIFLRQLVLETDLEESIKWMFPVYSFGKKNIISFGAFKNYVGIWFFQGVFLADPLGILTNAQKEKTKAMRQWRFTNIEEIKKHKNNIQAYFSEAIQNHFDGKEILPDRSKKEVIIPKELQELLKSNKAIFEAFEKITPGKKREFCEYIASAKRVETKIKRLEKIKEMILNNVSLNDKYRK